MHSFSGKDEKEAQVLLYEPLSKMESKGEIPLEIDNADCQDHCGYCTGMLVLYVGPKSHESLMFVS